MSGSTRRLKDGEGKPWFVYITLSSVWSPLELPCFYRALFSGEKRAARPNGSVVNVSFSGFCFLKRDGRFRIWTSFLNCWQRAFCWQGRERKREERLKTAIPGRTNFIEWSCCTLSAAERMRFTAQWESHCRVMTCIMSVPGCSDEALPVKHNRETLPPSGEILPQQLLLRASWTGLSSSCLQVSGNWVREAADRTGPRPPYWCLGSDSWALSAPRSEAAKTDGQSRWTHKKRH